MGITRASFLPVAVACVLFAETSLFAQEPIANYVCCEEALLGHVTVYYDVHTGEVRVNTFNSEQRPLDSIVLEIDPAATEWRFKVGEDPDGDNFYDGCAFDKGFFNVCRPDKVAIIDVNGVGAWPNTVSLGNIAEPRLRLETLLSTWLISGSHKGGGGLNRFQGESMTGLVGPGLAMIPEPSSMLLLGLGLVGLVGMRRHSRPASRE